MSTVMKEFEFYRNHGVSRLRTHDVTLRGPRVTLRPSTVKAWLRAKTVLWGTI